MSFNVGLFITYLLSIIIMVGLPIALVFFVVKRFKVSWWVILTGVLTYIVSQVIHYPVLQQVVTLFRNGTLPLPADNLVPLFLAVVMGFLAALFEEGFRYFGFLVMKKKVKKLPSAIGMGIAHGGIESIALCAWPFWPIFSGFAVQFFYFTFYNPGAQLAKGVASEQVQAVLSYIQQFWSPAWHTGLQPGVERIIAIVSQILFSILIWKAVKNRNFGWFALAFGYHMLINGVSIFLQYNGWSYWAVDGIMALFMLVNLYLIYYFWKQESQEEDEGDEYEDDDEDDDEDEDDRSNKQSESLDAEEPDSSEE